MRTRRSPKNQEKLWRDLGGPRTVPIKVDEVTLLERYLSLPLISPRSRKKAERDLVKAKQKAAIKKALEGESK